VRDVGLQQVEQVLDPREVAHVGERADAEDRGVERQDTVLPPASQQQQRVGAQELAGPQVRVVVEVEQETQLRQPRAHLPLLIGRYHVDAVRAPEAALVVLHRDGVRASPARPKCVEVFR